MRLRTGPGDTRWDRDVGESDMNGIDLPDRRVLLTFSFVAVTALIVGIIGLVYCNVLTINGGSLVMSGVLTLATFGYVALTFDMSRTMREEMRLQHRQVKLEQKPEVMEALETEVLPLYNDVMNVKGVMSGTGTVQVDNEYYPAYPYVPTEFQDPSTVPRLLQSPIDIDPGDAHAFYMTYRDYRQVYGDTVDELQRLILTDLDSPPSDSMDLRELAMLALQLDTNRIGSTRIMWNSRKNDVIPLRRDIPELMQELSKLQHQVRRDGSELAADLSNAINDAMREYEIDGSQLHPDPVPTEWPDDEIGQTGVFIGSLPHRPRFAGIEVTDGEDDEPEDTDGTESDGSKD